MKDLIKIVLVVALIMWTVGCGVSAAFAEIPRLINFQGKLADSDGKPITGTRDVAFRIYGVESGGTPLWNETQTVTIQKGIFNVLLGSSTDLNLPFDQPYWLEIKVGTDAPMTPRQRVTSAGYAIRTQNANQAQNADTIDGIHASTSPEANKLLALNSTGKFPSNALGLKVYDSGWFACTTGGTYTKNHNLGTTKILYRLYFATDSIGSDMAGTDFLMDINYMMGGQIKSITTTQLTVQAANSNVASIYGSGGIATHYSSGYYRVVVLALE